MQLLEVNISALIRVLSLIRVLILTEPRKHTEVAKIHIHLLGGWKSILNNSYWLFSIKDE